MQWCAATSEGRQWKVWLGSALLFGGLCAPSTSWAQARTNEPVRGPSPDTAPQGDEDEEEKEEAAGSAAGSTAPTQPSVPKVVVTTGAPQPPSQNQATPLPPSTQPATPSQAVVRVGGNMILFYSNNYKPEYDNVQGHKKHLFDAWRVGMVLDGKLDRFGMHIEFRARDRGLRWQPVNSWLEETYASAEIMKADNKYGPLVLKAGKEYVQFGKAWDNSFYGPVAFRDGLKLDSSWGFSLEGTLFPTKPLGLRYFAQYYINDGQTGTVQTNRDTISIVTPGTISTQATALTPPYGRRRDRFVARLEPFYKWSPTGVVRLGASIDHFTADFADSTPDPTNPRVLLNDNTHKVTRYAVDLTAQLAWFGLWAEFDHQEGLHTNQFPYTTTVEAAATATTPALPRLEGNGYKKADWFMAGANFTYSRYTLQYNYSQGKYSDIEIDRPARGAIPALKGNFSHKEWIHNPSIQVAINEQIRLIFELPFWMRDPAPGLAFQDAKKVPALNVTGKKEVIEQQFLATLHGKF